MLWTTVADDWGILIITGGRRDERGATVAVGPLWAGPWMRGYHGSPKPSKPSKPSKPDPGIETLGEIIAVRILHG